MTRAEKHAAAMREAAMRRRVYPSWVRQGRMTQAEADHEIAAMEAIARDYAPGDLFGDGSDKGGR